jgi:methionine synthase II (cobalamin-independent)
VFSTVFGALPWPSDEPAPTDPDARRAAVDRAVRTALEAQTKAGIDLLSDGGLTGPIDLAASAPSTVACWRFAADAAPEGRPVKAVLPGPLSIALAAEPTDLMAAAHAAADRLRSEVEALAAAGCPLIEIDEPAALRLGDDGGLDEAFAAAHRRLAVDAPVHLSLALAGGNLAPSAYPLVLATAYPSYLVDLIAGPDNWRLVVDIPGDRGVVCAALRAVEGSDDGPELLVWAAHYAASTRRRGLDRVGLANAPGLDGLAWPVARRKLERLAEASRIAALPRSGGALRSALDPRATDLKSRALRRHAPRPRGK